MSLISLLQVPVKKFLTFYKINDIITKYNINKAIKRTMENVLKVINELVKEGLIKDYAIGGGIATVFYIEPILTYVLDIFYIPIYEEEVLITLKPIYDFLRKKGYRESKEHVEIEGIPVQFIPVYNELVKDAVKNAVEIKYKDSKTKIVEVEYLIAILLQTNRPKDKERVLRIMDEANVDKKSLKQILKKYALSDKFKLLMKLYNER